MAFTAEIKHEINSLSNSDYMELTVTNKEFKCDFGKTFEIVVLQVSNSSVSILQVKSNFQICKIASNIRIKVYE